MTEATGNRRTSMRATDKPFNIDKKLVYEAYKAVQSNGGAAGVDGQTIEQFEADLKSNLYKIWNRMSSGSYFPPPVRAVSIPKKSGGQRILGVPTVADRVAQMVVKQVIEPILDPVFLADSYGYRPRKSALDAVGVTRERCWKYDWVLEFDIKGLFDNIDHELLLRAVLCGFNPAVSPSAMKAMRSTIRELKFRHQTQLSLQDIAQRLNPLLRGWIEYYGRYAPSALYPLL